MRNELNVVALEIVLRSFFTSPYQDYRFIAEGLADRGVLVPSALTDEQATSFPFDMDFMATGADGELVEPAADRRAALERIAKGE
jgi:hypothetical protein